MANLTVKASSRGPFSISTGIDWKPAPAVGAACGVWDAAGSAGGRGFGFGCNSSIGSVFSSGKGLLYMLLALHHALPGIPGGRCAVERSATKRHAVCGVFLNEYCSFIYVR